MVGLIVALIIWGVVIGVGFMVVISGFRTIAGTLLINLSDTEEDPYIFLELSNSVESLINKKRVVFRIKTIKPPK